MFTGIIEELGKVISASRHAGSMQLAIEGEKVMADLKPGDSISVNGVCLTVKEVTNKAFEVDVVAETLMRTSLANLKIGQRVNLERAMKLGDRLGGHILYGHIDGVGKILRKQVVGNSIIFRISVPQDLTKYIVPKGAIGIDGVSLTVSELKGDQLEVAIIPYTQEMTTFGQRRTGDEVNIEVDIMAKYLEKLALSKENPAKEKISADFLGEHGFI